MKNNILDLKQRVYQLTSDFSGALTSAMIALNTPPLTGEAWALVRQCRAVGRDYEEALDRLLVALREEGDDPGQAARAERLRELLKRELSILESHPALRAQAE